MINLPCAVCDPLFLGFRKKMRKMSSMTKNLKMSYLILHLIPAPSFFPYSLLPPPSLSPTLPSFLQAKPPKPHPHHFPWLELAPLLPHHYSVYPPHRSSFYRDLWYAFSVPYQCWVVVWVFIYTWLSCWACIDRLPRFNIHRYSDRILSNAGIGPPLIATPDDVAASYIIMQK